MTSSRQPIVVGYDASEDADRALAWAIDFVKARGNPLRVVVASGDLDYLPEWSVIEQEQVVSEWARTADAWLADAGVTGAQTIQSSNRVVPDLLEQSEHAALVVIGAQGHGAVSGFLIGSVSQHLARHASCPVVVVRGEQPARGPVVVGIDGSEGSTSALEFAFEEASWTGADLIVVHARDVAAVNGAFDVTIAPEVDAEMEEARRLLAESVAGLREKYPDVRVSLEPVPLAPAKALVEAAAHASLLVVGTRGRGGFVGLLLGSVSQAVVAHAACSVAVVR